MPVTILIISWLPVKSWLVILDLPKWQFSFFGKKLKQWTHPFMGNFWYVYWSMKIIKKYYLPKYNFFWQIGIKAWLPITHRWVLLLASCSFICWSILLNILSIYYQSLTTHHKIVCLFFSIHVCCQSLCSFRWLSSSVYLSSFSLKPIQYFFDPLLLLMLIISAVQVHFLLTFVTAKSHVCGPLNRLSLLSFLLWRLLTSFHYYYFIFLIICFLKVQISQP